ncbi:hypothetical protein CD006_06315 [Enterobacter sp. 10-1]|nr:hypothetical protein CD006_06315 [Enterobacter sp. 10-1]
MLAEIRQAGCRKAFYCPQRREYGGEWLNPAPFWRAARQKRANIYDKFRRGSQIQNYILPMNKLSILFTVHHR